MLLFLFAPVQTRNTQEMEFLLLAANALYIYELAKQRDALVLQLARRRKLDALQKKGA